MTDGAISIKDQAAYLRANNFWIGRTYSENFVKNLYDLASRNIITSKQWNDYGDVSKSWDKQSRTILQISAISDPKQAGTTEEKASVLKINGYWIDGRAVGEGVVDNLYTLYAQNKISAEEWNKLGVATLAWNKQSASITSRLDTTGEVAQEEPATPASKEPEPAPAEPAPSDEVPEKDPKVLGDDTADGISKKAEELASSKMTEQELRDALTNDSVLRQALRELAEAGAVPNSEQVLKIINEIENVPADGEKKIEEEVVPSTPAKDPTPAPAEPEAADTTEDAKPVPTKPQELAQGASTPQSSQQVDVQEEIAKLQEQRADIELLMRGSPVQQQEELLGKIPASLKEFKMLKKETLSKIDDQIKRLRGGQ